MSEQNPKGNQRNRNQNRNRSNNGPRNKNHSTHKQNDLQPSRRRGRSKPKPLTFWQKFLKALGLYKDPNAKRPVKGSQPAKKSGRVEGGGRVNQTKKSNNRPARKKSTPEPTEVSSPRLYVGNLSYDAAEYDLEELFKGIGSVRKVELVYNRHTHKSKGYGFVNMANLEEAERAVEVLHDQPFMGRKMIVNGARSKGPIDSNSENRAPREKKAAPTEESPSLGAPTGDIPANEEVHSLSQD